MKKSEHAMMAAIDISNNGAQILNRPKYQKIIDTTMIIAKGDFINYIGYYDHSGAEVAWFMPIVMGDKPIIGKVIYTTWESYKEAEKLEDIKEIEK